MSARRPERAEARHAGVEPCGARRQSGETGVARMLGAEHRLAQHRVGVAPAGDVDFLARLGTGERLLGSVVDARNAEAEKLHGDAGDYLMVAGGAEGEANLVTGDVVVIVKNAHAARAAVAMRPEV